MSNVINDRELVPETDEDIVIDLAETDYFKVLGDPEVWEGQCTAMGAYWVFDEIFEGELRDWAQFATMFNYHLRHRPDIEDIRINIADNYGGRVSTALAMYDGIRSLSVQTDLPVVTLAMGVCASAAVQIVLQAGDRRMATPHSIFLVHEISKSNIFSNEKVSEMKDSQVGVDMMAHMMFSLMAKKCGKTVEEIKRFVERHERWMSAQEALDFGLIDEIIEEDECE